MVCNRVFLLFVLVLFHLPAAHRAIEINWTPADGEGTGPMPVSKRYRDQMEKLQQLEAEQASRDRARAGASAHPPPASSSMPSAQKSAVQQHGVLGSLFFGVCRHPLSTATLAATVWAGYRLRRAARETGCLVSKSPHFSVWEPPLGYVARLLNEDIPALRLEDSLASVGAGGSPAGFARVHRAGKEGPGLGGGREEGKGEGGAGTVVFESVQVGSGEVSFRKATDLVRTLRLFDAAASSSSSSSSPSCLGRFYSSERAEEGVFVARATAIPGASKGLRRWALMPVRIFRQEGREKLAGGQRRTKRGKMGGEKNLKDKETTLKKRPKKKKGGKRRKGGRVGGRKVETSGKEGGQEGRDASPPSREGKRGGRVMEVVYAETVLRPLPGSVWTGDLCLTASWRDPRHGGDDGVHVQVTWHRLPSPDTSLPSSFQREVAAALLHEARKLVAREMVIHRARERQQGQLAQDAARALQEKKKKERQLLLNPPPDKKKWKKMQRQGGKEAGPGRWQPSADLAARRNPRRGG